jgi:hypothetical protein
MISVLQRPWQLAICGRLHLGAGGNLVTLATSKADDFEVTLNASVPSSAANPIADDTSSFNFDRAPVAVIWIPWSKLTCTESRCLAWVIPLAASR